MLRDFVRIVTLALFLACWGIDITAWFVLVISLVQLAFNAVPDGIPSWLGVSRLNVVFDSDKLTPRGIVLRRRFFIACGAFASSLAAAAAVAGAVRLIGPAT